MSFQLAGSRSPISEYIEAAQHVLRRRNGEEVVTKLIVIISTWHFTRDNENIESPTIYPSDCTVQFKYSSSEFQAQTGEETLDGSGFNFDKNGLIFPYPVFVNLMKSHKFQHYIKNCVEHRAKDIKALEERKRGLTLEIAPEPQIPIEIIDDNDNDDEEVLPLKRKSKGKIEGPVKRIKFPSSPSASRRPTEEEITARLGRAVNDIE